MSFPKGFLWGDLHRAKKDSFYWYQKVLKSNGEEGLD